MGTLFLLLYATGVQLIERELVRESVVEMKRQVTGGSMDEMARTVGYHFLLMAGFYVVHFLAVMLAIFSSANAVSGEISSHTIQTIVTKPVRRWEVLLGKWLGYAASLVLYLGFLGGGVLLTIYATSGYLPQNAVEALLVLMLEALVLLSLSLLGGTRLSSLTNGAMLFLLYALGFIGGWVGQIGSLFQSESAARVATATTLLIPVEALWRRAASLMEPPLLSNLPFSPFTGGSHPGAGVVAYGVLYAAFTLVLAMRSFGRRDL